MLRIACYMSLCCSSSYWDDVGIVVLNQCNQPIFSTIMKNVDILYIFIILSKTFIDALKYKLNILILGHIISLKATIEFFIFQFSTWFFSPQNQFHPVFWDWCFIRLDLDEQSCQTGRKTKVLVSRPLISSDHDCYGTSNICNKTWY